MLLRYKKHNGFEQWFKELFSPNFFKPQDIQQIKKVTNMINGETRTTLKKLARNVLKRKGLGFVR